MPYKELHYRWTYDLKSTPDRLWTFVADTNRFNRDTNVPSVDVERQTRRLRNARRRIRLSVLGMPVEWEEQPFEWVRPSRFGVVRTYSKGPIAELKALAVLSPKSDSGTKLTYEVWVTPKSLLGVVAAPFQIGLIASRRFRKAFRRYDAPCARANKFRSAHLRFSLPTCDIRHSFTGKLETRRPSVG